MRRPGGLIAVQPSIGCVSSKDGKVQMQILAQPEQQHRARLVFFFIFHVYSSCNRLCCYNKL